MSVSYLHYNDEQLPVKAGYYMLKHSQAEGKNVADLGSNIAIYETLLFYALKKGAKLEGIPFTWKKTDMEDILEECYDEFNLIVVQSFADNLEKLKGEEDQKSSIMMNSQAEQ